jgi:hypothetical protein
MFKIYATLYLTAIIGNGESLIGRTELKKKIRMAPDTIEEQITKLRPRE